MPSGQVISGRLKAEAVLMNYRCISPSDGEGGAILPVAHGCGDISKVVSLLARHPCGRRFTRPRYGVLWSCLPRCPGAAWVNWRAWAPPSISSHKRADEAFHAPLRSFRLGREQTTARILLHGQPSADCDFNLAALHPAYPIKRRTSAQRTQASQGVEIRKKLAPLTHWRTISASRASCEDRRAKGQSRNSHEQALESAGVEASVQRSARGWIA
jgi:hypothetical protein